LGTPPFQRGLLQAEFDIFALVDEFRKSRPSIVQTDDQYFMIFKSILNLVDQFQKGLLAQTSLYGPAGV
jgi:protein tyrosine phosphatase